jgi:NAD(P)-dependent dehydrogenase (short-subunit alcohol dehydrogenase family)
MLRCGVGIHISSGVTWFVSPQIMYSMTNGALNVLTRSLANILGARGITFDGAARGVARTEGSTHPTGDVISGMAAITPRGRVERARTSPTSAPSLPTTTAAGSWVKPLRSIVVSGSAPGIECEAQSAEIVFMQNAGAATRLWARWPICIVGDDEAPRANVLPRVEPRASGAGVLTLVDFF